jgi:hypothetical protein
MDGYLPTLISIDILTFRITKYNIFIKKICIQIKLQVQKVNLFQIHLHSFLIFPLKLAY